MSGCLKLLFTNTRKRVDGILINCSGGLTSGDRISLRAEAEQGACLAISTQAAERAYRATSDAARVRTELSVEDNAELLWLPQELILFDGARLDRKLTCELAPTAKALLIEPIVFGRHAMGETLDTLHFKDHIRVTRNGVPLYSDVIRIDGDAASLLKRPAIANGMGAMATLIYVASDAETKTAVIQRNLPDTAGASLIHDDVMIMRALAYDGFALRQTLVPILDTLTGDTLPKSWRL